LTELEAVMDPMCSTWLVTQYQVNQDFRYFGYELYYTRLGFIGDFLGSKYFGNNLFSLNIRDIVSTAGSCDYSQLPDPYGQDPEPSNITGAALHGLIRYAQDHDANVIVLPNHVESFIAFCNALEPSFVPRLKKSFVTNSILEYLFHEYLSSAEVNVNLTRTKPFLNDFRRGVIEMAAQFDGSYYLSNEQIRWLREYVADQTGRVLKYLNPIQLKRLVNMDITNLANLAEATIDAAKLLPWPIPLGILIESAKKLRDHHKFKAEGADFGLALILLQQLLNSKPPSKPTGCEICNMSISEMDSCTHDEVLFIMDASKLCQLHTIGFLHIRKKFRLTGSDLLKAVKAFDMQDLSRLD
jgi:hypothetical protein